LLPDVLIPFAVRLQPSRVQFVDIAGLEPGDVLRLDHGLDDVAVGVVGDQAIVQGRVGKVRNKLALELEGWLDRGVEGS
jgi:flagellar motor switch protein FliM